MSTDKDWEITYSLNGEPTKSVVKPWPEEPSQEFAAQLLKEHIFGDQWLIPATPRDVKDVTVWQMGQLGYVIKSITEWKP